MLCPQRAPILPSLEWQRLFHLEGTWIVHGGTFRTLEVSPPDFDPLRSESNAVEGDADFQPTVTIETHPAELGVELFFPLPDQRKSWLFRKLRRAQFMRRDGDELWWKRCTSPADVVQTVNVVFAILKSSSTSRVYQRAVVVPELVDLANAVVRRFPHWLDDRRSRPFGFLELNVNGVTWLAYYDREPGTYSVDCMGYCDTWKGTIHACSGPCRVPRWLFSRCHGVSEASFKYDEDDWASSVTFRDPGQLIEMLASLQLRLQADLIIRLIDIDS